MRIDSPLGGEPCAARIPVKCEYESLDLLKREHRGGKPPSSGEISASSAVRWLQHWQTERISGPKPRGGSISPLERHAEWILALVTEQPDLTLDEIVSAMRKNQIHGSRSALWRFFARHNITVKKKLASRRTAACRRS